MSRVAAKRQIKRLWARLRGDQYGALTEDQQALYSAVRLHVIITGLRASALLPRISDQLAATQQDRRAVTKAIGGRW